MTLIYLQLTKVQIGWLKTLIAFNALNESRVKLIAPVCAVKDWQCEFILHLYACEPVS